jgi:hypothetical protein
VKGRKSMIFDIKHSPLRLNSSFNRIGFGVKGKVLLTKHLSFPEALLQEPMHLLYEGVGKFLLKYIFMVKKYPCYLSESLIFLTGIIQSN